MALLREFFAPFVDASPGMAGMEDCESLTHLRNKKTIAEEYPARHFLGIQRALDNGTWATFIGYQVRRVRRMAPPR